MVVHQSRRSSTHSGWQLKPNSFINMSVSLEEGNEPAGNVVPLRCAVQRYAWGRPAAVSEVAALARANGVTVGETCGEDETTPYAELWVGAHPSAPSMVMSLSKDAPAQPLDVWLARHRGVLGQHSSGGDGVTLPFLLKVLSVRTALSLQSHPDRPRAERLHAAWPRLYPDANHKPEMAVALRGGMQALCGFAPPAELAEMLSETPELCDVLGAKVTNTLLAVLHEIQYDMRIADFSRPMLHTTLRRTFEALFRAPKAVVARAIELLVRRADAEQQRQGSGSSWTSLMEDDPRARRLGLVSRLHHQHPGGDVGVLAALFLNHVHLEEGDALVVPPNVPHAYLSGELVECMAASDNVIRAGLTSKFKDVEELLDSLDYRAMLPRIIPRPPCEDGCPDADTARSARVAIYTPPFSEFQVSRLRLEPGDDVRITEATGAQLMLVQHGSGVLRQLSAASPDDDLQRTTVVRGTALLIPAGCAVGVTATQDAHDARQDLVCWLVGPPIPTADATQSV